MTVLCLILFWNVIYFCDHHIFSIITDSYDTSEIILNTDLQFKKKQTNKKTFLLLM